MLKFDYQKIPKEKQEVLEVDRKTGIVFLVIMIIVAITSIITQNEIIVFVSLVFMILEIYFLRKWKRAYKILNAEYNKMIGEKTVYSNN